MRVELPPLTSEEMKRSPAVGYAMESDIVQYALRYQVHARPIIGCHMVALYTQDQLDAAVAARDAEIGRLRARLPDEPIAAATHAGDFTKTDFGALGPRATQQGELT